MHVKKLDNLKYLYILLPIALVSGPLVSDLIVTFISLYFIIFHYDKFSFFFEKYLYIKILVIFCLLNIIVALFSENILNSLKNSITYLRFPIFIIAISFLFRDNQKLIKYFYYVLFFTIFIVSLDALFQFFTGKNVLGYVSNSRNRISGFFNDEFILGSYLARLTPILISLYFFIDKKKNKITLILISTLSFWTILISGERTSLGISIFFYLFLLFLILDLDIKKKIVFSLLLVLSLLFVISSSKILKERYVKTTLFQLESILQNYQTSAYNEDKDIGVFNNQHIKHLKVSYQIFREKPYFGHGNKMFAQICFDRYFVDDGRCSTHPHNFLAQILVENGLIGALFYLSLFSILIVYFYKAYKKKNKATMTILLICILSFFPFFPSGNFYNNLMSIFLFTPLSIYFVLNENTKSL